LFVVPCGIFFFRIENEHLNNFEKFRVTSLVPLDLNYESMDRTRDNEKRVLDQIADLEPMLQTLGTSYGYSMSSTDILLKKKKLQISKSKTNVL